MYSISLRSLLLASTACYIAFAAPANATLIETGNFSAQRLQDLQDTGVTVTVPAAGSLPSASYFGNSLQSIVITLNVHGTASPVITNNSATTAYSYTGASVLITGLTVTSGAADGLSTSMNVNGSTSVGATVAPSAVRVQGPAFGFSGAVSVTVPVADWSQYLSNGALSLNFTVSDTGTSVFGGTTRGAATSNLSFGGSASLSGDVMITYQTIPEPGTLALLGGALVGAPLIRRRSRKQAG